MKDLKSFGHNDRAGAEPVTRTKINLILIMPKKATFETVSKKDQYNCSICKDTGIVYFVIESSFWRDKKVRTVEPQTCYSCQPKS